MRVLLAPHGSHGDVQPMLALAHALRDRGHTPAFVAPANFVTWIRSHGFDAESNGIDVEAVINSAGADLHSARWQMRHVMDLARQLFDALAHHSSGADLIVGAGVQMAASSIAEWRDIPYAMVAFCPCAVPGRGAPPPAVKTQTLPPWVNRLLWDLGAPIASLALRTPINKGRAKLGLRPVHDVLEDLAGDRILVAADPDLAPLGDDAPERAVPTDAWIVEDDDDVALDPRLAAFLQLDPAPVYVGFGSMVAKRVPAIASAAVAAIRAVGRAAIVAGGWADLGRHVGGDDLFVARAIPHARVLPCVAAVVHHGGAGTTTAAARAGVPQVVLPHILDQFYWAHRVAQLGLGPRALPVDLVTADVLADRLDAALSDPQYRTRATAMAPAIRVRNGAPYAATALEALVI